MLWPRTHAVLVTNFGPHGKHNFEKNFYVMVSVLGVNDYLLMNFDHEFIGKTMISGFRWRSDTCYALFCGVSWLSCFCWNFFITCCHSFYITLLSTWGCAFAGEEWHLVLLCAISIAWEFCYKLLLIEVEQKQHSFMSVHVVTLPMYTCGHV